MISLSDIRASVSPSLKMSELQNRAKAPEEQTTDLLETARHVDRNVKEARRLWHVKNDTLNDSERTWIDGVIGDTEEALRGISYAIESTGASKPSKNGADLSKKATWIFRGGPKIRDKHVRLHACHQSLTAAITCLFSKGISDAAPVQKEEKKGKETPPPYDAQLEQLFTWGKHRKRGRCSISSKEDKNSGPNSAHVISSSPSGNGTVCRAIPGAMEFFGGSEPAPIGLANEGRPLENPTQSATERPFSSCPSPGWNDLGGLSCAGNRLHSKEERPTSSVVDTLFLSPFISRPRANSLPTGELEEKVLRSHSSYPMSPSDYSTRYPPKPTAKTCRSPLKIPYNSSNHDITEAEQRGGKCDTDLFAVGRRVTKSRLIARYDPGPYRLKADGDGISKVGAADRIFQGSDGLQLAEATQPICLPYRLPKLSISSTSLCPSLTSMPDECDYAIQSSIDLPRLSIGLDPDQKQSAVEIGMASPESASPRLCEGLDPWTLPATRSELLSELRIPSYVNQAGTRKGSRNWLRFHAERNDP